MRMIVGLMVVLLLLSSPASARSQIVQSTSFGPDWPFPTEQSGSLYCKRLGGGRVAVWMVGDHGAYALNGQAMSWASAAGLVDGFGNPWKTGRDHSVNASGLHRLIKIGLNQCV